MVLGLRSMKKYNGCLNFCCNRLWTGPTGVSEVPVRYAISKLVLRQLPTVPPDPGGQTKSNSITDPQLCERPIQWSSRNCGSTDEIPKFWRVIHEKHCVRVVEEDEEVRSNWATDNEDNTIEVYPEVVSLEEALRRIGQPRLKNLAAFSEVGEDEHEAIRWERLLKLPQCRQKTKRSLKCSTGREQVTRRLTCRRWGRTSSQRSR